MISMEIFALIGFLIYAAIIVAGIMVVIALWRGMKAQERMANSIERMAASIESMERMADSIERIDTTMMKGIVNRDRI